MSSFRPVSEYELYKNVLNPAKKLLAGFGIQGRSFLIGGSLLANVRNHKRALYSLVVYYRCEFDFRSLIIRGLISLLPIKINKGMN